MPSRAPDEDVVGTRPLDWARRTVDDPRMTTTDRAACLAVLKFAPGKRQPLGKFGGQRSGWDFFVSHKDLAALMGVKSTKTAERSAGRIVSFGYLVQVSRGGHRGRQEWSTVYRLSLPQQDSGVPLGAAPNGTLASPSEGSQWDSDVLPNGTLTSFPMGLQSPPKGVRNKGVRNKGIPAAHVHTNVEAAAALRALPSTTRAPTRSMVTDRLEPDR